MRKITLLSRAVVVVCIMLSTLIACKSSFAYTFSVETGDKIKIKLDTSSDWSIKQKDGSFSVNYNGDTILQGVFGTTKNYEDLKKAVLTDEKAKLIEESEKDGNTYVFYNYNGTTGEENNIILMVKDASTCVILGSTSSQSEVEEAFKRLIISKD